MRSAEIAALRARVAELEAALRDTIEQIKRGDVGLPHSPHRDVEDLRRRLDDRRES